MVTYSVVLDRGGKDERGWIQMVTYSVVLDRDDKDERAARFSPPHLPNASRFSGFQPKLRPKQ